MTTQNYVPIKRDDPRTVDPILASLSAYADEVCGAVSGARLKYAKRDWEIAGVLVEADERFVWLPASITKRHEHWRDGRLIEARSAPLSGKLPPLVQPPESEWELGQDGRPKP